MPSIASKPYKAGDVISVCEPLFVCVEEEFKGIYCDNCLIGNKPLKKCAKCLKMYYCDKSCQINDWKYHKKECRIFAKSYDKLPMNSRNIIEKLLLRIWVCVKSDPEFVIRRHKLVDGSDISLNEIEVDDKQMAFLFKTDYYERLMFDEICRDFKDFGLKFDPKELLHWYTLIRRPIILPIVRYDENSFLLFFSTQIPVALGLYLQLVNMSHSCLPNCAYVYYGTSLQLRAMKSIDSGKQLTAAFIALNQNKSGRQRDLKLLLQSCECDKCRLNLDKDFDYYRFNGILVNHKLKWIKSVFTWLISNDYDYHIDIQMIKGLHQIFGEYNPYSAQFIALSFIYFAMFSDNNNPIVLTLWYNKILDIIGVTHGKDHPLYRLISIAYLQFV